MESLVDPLKVMVKVFRRECHRVLHSERTSIHGADGMLMVLHLAMAEVNKQHGGEFKVALSDVLMAWKHLLLHKLHLLPPGFARSGNYDLILEMYESFLKRSNTMDLVDIFSMYKQLRIVDLDPEEPLSPAQLFEFLSGSRNEFSEQPESTIPSTPLSKSRSWSSQVKMAVRRVFCSYLSLLVNSKNDMALAVTLDVPSRCLGRQAFTDIKRAARNSNTSLFLAVTSFVRAIQLGGKGYAPADSDPLRKHVKGLSDFVQFIDNLEEILGEVTDPSACGSRLVAAIRAALVKGRSSGDAVFTSAHETAQELNERICQLHHIQKQSSANGGGTGISPARPKAYTINHATAFGGRDTVKVLMALLDEEALTPPCQNKAELLSEDQPVLSGIEANSILSLFRSPEVSTGCSPEPLRNRVQSRRDQLIPKAKDRVIRSQFACTYKDEELPLNRVLEFPSTSQVPTCVHPAPKPQTIPSECGSDVEETNTDTESTPTIPKAKPSTEYPHTEHSIVPRGAALGQKSGNAQNRVAGSVDRKKSGIQRQPKTNKRKQVDSEQHGRSENEPPQKKQPTSVSVKMPGKTLTKASSKRKLIAGQGKLTSFFRV